MDINIYSSANYNGFYQQGLDFLEAAWRCFGKKEDEKYEIMKEGAFLQLSAPCIVNAAFSCEMFLKALLLKYQIPLRKIHGLYDIYTMLPSEIKGNIKKVCAKKLEKILKNHNTDFVDIRYFIEQKGWQKMKPMTMITVAENLSRITGAYLKPAPKKEVNNND
ncbi:MAG: HEPN domain-containing protein [Eubacterium sp.]|nr:HEPN domain-containing protein [Eubacterium sp.]